MDRFWSKADRQSTGCWEWTASRFSKGYGRFRLAGRTRQAHRVAFELANGQIPAGMLVCHRCDNPPCVNPDHLFLGTSSDNAVDMIRKGRHWIVNDPNRRATGAAAHLARLDNGDVEMIFRLRAEGLSQRSIAGVIGTSQSQVHRILSRQCWPDFEMAG